MYVPLPSPDVSFSHLPLARPPPPDRNNVAPSARFSPSFSRCFTISGSHTRNRQCQFLLRYLTLVFGVSNGALALIDCLYAGLRIAIGEGKDGFVVVQE